MKTQQVIQIRAKANELLKKCGISTAPVNVEGIASSLGILLRRTPAEDQVSGFLFKQKSGPTVIGVNSLHHPNRQRFTIAHELGHFILHDFDDVHVDEYVMKLRSPESSTGENKDEVEANRFAAELLMPEGILEQEIARLGVQDVSNDRAMQQLAKQFQVSVQAMSNRLMTLEYLAPVF